MRHYTAAHMYCHRRSAGHISKKSARALCQVHPFRPGNAVLQSASRLQSRRQLPPVKVRQCVYALGPVLIAGGFAGWLLRADGGFAKLGLAFLVCGAIVNAMDRLEDGIVTTDFLGFYAGSYHWPTFNLVDGFRRMESLKRPLTLGNAPFWPDFSV